MDAESHRCGTPPESWTAVLMSRQEDNADSPSGLQLVEIRNRLEELGVADQPDVARLLITEFLETNARHRQALVRATADGNVDEVARAAHCIAGAALTLGASQLGEEARALEKSAPAAGSGLAATVSALLDQLDRTSACCARELARQPAR